MTDVWIFGYGSLVWRPDFPYAEARPATISGWTRRFWQGSTDNRGVPGAPGRVVTLVEAEGEICWGRAFLIDGNDRADVMRHLDYREKGGYSLHEVDIDFPDADVPAAKGLIYIANPGNPNWLGERPISDIAQQVLTSVGPSGINTEYVLKLAEALQELGATDDHVFELAAHVRTLAEKSQA